jgi:hypothetical protein
MALPVICPECGVHNPPENRWCDCGYDLNNLSQPASVPTITSDLVEATRGLPDNIDSEHKSNQAAPPNPTVSHKSYIVHHWKGELSLTVAFWVNLVLLSAVLSALEQLFTKTRFVEHPQAGARIIIIYYIARLVIVYPWQVVGVWRACKRHADQT